jgi:hypothetical protein
MIESHRGSCSVCGASDQRALVEVVLSDGGLATLCGSHALIYNRSGIEAPSARALRELLRDRRGRWERRQDGDELGLALTQAFSDERREADRRRA